MKRSIIITATLLAALIVPGTALHAQRQWEEMEGAPAAVERVDASADGIDITVKDGYVYVTTDKPVTVKIFSILGQLISQKTVQPGTWRTHITARGIYILKAGSVTRRITI